jgi:hypothetical protein
MKDRKKRFYNNSKLKEVEERRRVITAIAAMHNFWSRGGNTNLTVPSLERLVMVSGGVRPFLPPMSRVGRLGDDDRIVLNGTPYDILYCS